MTLENLFSLDGKVIVITGAAGLLGAEHAEAVALSGGIPILLDLDKHKVTEIAKNLSQKYDCQALGFAVDITKEQQTLENANEIVRLLGRIDGLVNNAANNPQVSTETHVAFSRLENFSLTQWNDDINVGLTGAFLCSKNYGLKIAENSEGGIIVNVSSDLGLVAPDQRLYSDDVSNLNNDVKPITYSVVKTGLIGLTRYLATYWTDQNVRCNAICPGGVENGQPNEFLDKVKLRIPMKRLAQKDEYRGTLIWMLSDASNYLNGAIVPVDGGRTVW